MNWFSGSIVEAISASKAKSAIFVVYIEGQDETSKNITELVNTPQIIQLLGSGNFVAIKIEANSLPHQQFSEIYQNASQPSLVFIGKSGQVLEIIKDSLDLPALLNKLNNIIAKAGGTPQGSSADFIQNEQAPPPNIVCENGIMYDSTIKRDSPPVEPSVSTSNVAEASSSVAEASTTVAKASSPTKDEKIQKAKEILEIKQKMKEAEERENERKKELERRQMGQDVQQLKRWQEDQELKLLKEERDREKRENQAARDRVLAQIAQDKAERASKFSPSAPSTSAPSPVVQNEPKAAPKTDVSRLQFKLPDGSTHTHDFQNTDTLKVVREYISNNINLTFTNYSLSTTFPRREFKDTDNSKTLLEMELVPSAVILILPINKGGVVTTNQGQGGLMGMFWTVTSPIWSILGFLKLFIFGTPANTGDSSPGTSGSGSGSYSRGRNTVQHVRSKTDLNSKLASAGTRLVVIDFFATWCGPCKMIAPKMEELAREFSNVVFLKVDVDDNADIAMDYRVSAMPTFVFIKNKRILTNFSGADYGQLRSYIMQYK